MDSTIIDIALLPRKRKIWVSETWNGVSIVISALDVHKVTYRVIYKIVRWGQSGEELSGCKNQSNPLHCIREQRTRELAGDCSGRCEKLFDIEKHEDQDISIMENRKRVMVRLESVLICTSDILPNEVSVLCGMEKIRTCVPRWQHGKLRRSIDVMEVG
jgi:hypothetical protein